MLAALAAVLFPMGLLLLVPQARVLVPDGSVCAALIEFAWTTKLNERERMPSARKHFKGSNLSLAASSHPHYGVLCNVCVLDTARTWTQGQVRFR